ncbi:MAG TPA: choice-of-anchor tandem repeat GloVer-containing protein [Candidatus Dormibacteraeota bacterium]|nr:choice-of-anchor tandem repeat GloVer-containing protein [Candidatus Dormibacteraeota bacterium]
MKSNYHQGKRSGVIAMALTLLAVVGIFAKAVPAHAQTPTVLHTFELVSTDACEPEDNIVQGRDGNMYGVGVSCGTSGTGAVYKISPSGAESVVYNFPSGWSSCFSGLTLGSDGNFYGTCFTTPTGNGSIFQLTPAGVFTDLHDFTGANGDTEPLYAPVQATDGNFYGTTGYYPFSCGNVYQLTAAGVYKNLHTFSGSDCGPASSLFQASDGNLYGTLFACSINGSGPGCVYKISTGGVFKEIYGFASSTGDVPCTGVIQGKDGKLYGATNQGGANTFGNIYKLTTAGVHTDLHDFDQATDASCVFNVGRTTVNLLQVTDGSFYGVNGAYGPIGNGSIYKLTSANVFTAFLFPNPPVDGNLPVSTLIQNTNGLVYGTTPSGGPISCLPCSQGTFFSVATGDAAFVNLEPTQRTGLVGASVGMFGQGFSSASVVTFGGVAATTVTLSGTSYLTAVVPAGAHTGTVKVTTGATTLTSPQTFKVKPKITSFSPPSGSIGTLVTINGSGLTQATTVKFGTVKATTFTVVSDSEVTADVPSGLAAGAVTISITTPGGTANSPTKFTVN